MILFEEKMAEFQEIAKDTHWPDIRGPWFIGNQESPVTYIQDMKGLDSRKRVAPGPQIVAANRYVPPSQDNRAGESLLWPKYALERGQVAPFVAFGGVAFAVAPGFDSQVGIGAALVAAWFAAAAVSYAQRRNEPHLREPSNQIHSVDPPQDGQFNRLPLAQ